MIRFTIQTAANAWRTSTAPKLFKHLINIVNQTFCFQYERGNRFKRCMKIISLYAAGVAVRDIEERYGCSRYTALRYARAAKLPTRAKGHPEKIRLATLAMYKDKKPISEIQARLGVSQAYISNLATKEGINRKRDKRRNNVHQKSPPATPHPR